MTGRRATHVAFALGLGLSAATAAEAQYGEAAPPAPAPAAPEQPATAQAATSEPSLAPSTTAAAAPAAVPEAPPAPAAPAAPTTPPWTFRLGEALFHPELQIRPRGEVRGHPYGVVGAPPPPNETHFVTTRFRVGLGMDWRMVRMRIQVQDAREFGTVPPGTDGSVGFGVHQGYGELRDGGSFLRVGRQEVAYGDERLIGPLDWQSAARSFDAIRGHYEHGIWAFDGMGAIVHNQMVYTNTTTTPPSYVYSDGDYLAAAQAAVRPSDALHVELLYLYRRDRAVSATPPPTSQRISATSLRLDGSPFRGFRYMAEGVFEWGEISHDKFIAYAAAADVWYSLAQTNPTTFNTGFALGSGNHNGKVGQFNNFYPTNHKFYGYMDLFGWRNIIEGHVNVTQRLASSRASLFAQGYAFFLEYAGGSWTNAVGATLSNPTPGSSRYVGSELDLGGSYKVNELFGLTGGFSFFVPGAAAERMNHDQVQTWGWLMLDFKIP
ncbi:MAG: alginate export family protein [Polyangiales bacterium]